MRNLLLNPNGRIVRNRFWQGIVILTVVSVLIAAGGVMVGSAFSVLSLVVIYPYICVYTKRLHDAGFSGWLVIIVWLASVVVSLVASMVLAPFFQTSETIAMQQEITERMNAGDLTGAFEGMELLGAIMLPATLISTVFSNAFVAVIVGLLPSDPNPNKHGPVVG